MKVAIGRVYGRHVGHEVGIICIVFVAFILWDYECSYTACLQSTITGSVHTHVDSMYSGSFVY